MATGTELVPSSYVKENGAVPVKVNVTSGRGDPKQAVPPPLMTAVGDGMTVTSALPVMLGSGAVALHVVTVLVTLTIVYDVVNAGTTVAVAPLLIELSVKLLVPSV